ncbi:FAD-dependent oxidoreductase [Novosphingobium bradum]|uniref:FAD-dependent oxidoreductase n=1 Tax=Novosphingobium bradum TaxID=1737444 RepID=A0ABV7IM59_9SPHN
MDFDETVDAIIVGSGAGAVCAALYLKSCNKRAVILEKTDRFGGSTAISGGIVWAPGNMLMRRAGIADSEERALTYFDVVVGDVGPASSLARRKAFLRGIDEALRFLESRGMAFFRQEGYADYYDDRPGGEPRGRTVMARPYDLRDLGEWAAKLRGHGAPAMPINTHEGGRLATVKTTWRGKRAALRVAWRMLVNRLTGRQWVGSGNALQGRLLRLALDAGIDIRLETPVTDLIIDQGRVTGVAVAAPGGPRRIRARDGVLISAGGFAHNARMREHHGPHPASVDWTMANPGDTGEMIEAGQRAGAAVDLMDAVWWTSASLPAPGQRILNVTDVGRPHAIIVDQSGRRYMNEAASYVEVGNNQYARNRTVPAIPSWLILDHRNRSTYPLFMAMPGKTPQAWLDSGYLKRAPTLEALAEDCGIDPQALRETVERFNGFARNGVDEDFRRGARQYDHWLGGDPSVGPNPSLAPLETAPFYALRLYPGDVGTAGGLLTDEHARVLRPDGSAIPGLYATGNSTASVMGRHYPGAGSSIAASLAFAWQAVRHMVGRNDG